MPAACQVSSIVSCDIGMKAHPDSSVRASLSSAGIPQIHQFECQQPEVKSQRPLTTAPPSTIRIVQVGASEPQSLGRAPSAKISSCVSGEARVANHADTFIKVCTQAVDGQPLPSSAETLSIVSIEAPCPPRRL